MLNSYQKIQIVLVYLVIGIFITYLVMDIRNIPMSETAKGMFVSIWSIILVLLDAKGLSNIIQVSNSKMEQIDSKIDRLQTTLEKKG